MNEQTQVFICPRCGVMNYFGNIIETCIYCKIDMINTSVTTSKYFYEMTHEECEIFNQQSIEQFCHSSSLYSPEDEARNALLEKKRVMEENAQRSRDLKERSIPKCPTCQSTDIVPISGLERGASVLALGLFSKKLNKSFKCNHCGYTW